RQQPAADNRPTGNVNEFPCDQGERSVRRRLADGRISQREKPIVQPADYKEPTEAEGVALQEFPMRSEGFAQSLVMENERYLHRGETEDEDNDCATSGGQIVKHPR